jgi:hypothetical protein
VSLALGCPSGVDGFPCCNGNDGGKDASKGQQAEEFLPARIAAIGWKSEEALEEHQSAILHPVTRDALEVEVSAARAVGIPREGDRHARGIESKFACEAAPGLPSDRAAKEVCYACSAGTKTVSTPALRADHLAD